MVFVMQFLRGITIVVWEQKTHIFDIQLAIEQRACDQDFMKPHET